VSGYYIEAVDGGIGHVEDVIVDGEAWAIRYILVDTANWWPGKKAMISPEWIREVSWSDSRVYVDLRKSRSRRHWNTIPTGRSGAMTRPDCWSTTGAASTGTPMDVNEFAGRSRRRMPAPAGRLSGYSVGELPERGREQAAWTTPLRIRKARRAAIAASSRRGCGEMRQRWNMSGEPAALRRLILGPAHSSRSYRCRPRLSSLLLRYASSMPARLTATDGGKPPLTWQIRAGQNGARTH
jgi:hypothetical protein